MAELDKGLFSSVGETPVDVDMLDFAYVEECQDWKKLYSILEVLKSGKEGFYPELMKATEDKMLATMPDKERRKYLALKSTASAEEVASASEDIRQWQASSMSIDAQLKTGQLQRLSHHNNGGLNANDVFSQISRVQREKIEEAGRKLKVAELSEFQKERRAELERRKGNESFKASEYEASIRFYTISIALNPLNDSVWANRAIAHIKLKLFDLAEQDCNACLMLNESNVKALARRGFARFSQGKYSAAALDYHSAMKLDQSNEEYPKFLAKAKEMYLASEGKELVIEGRETVLEKVEHVRIVHSNTSGTWISEHCIAVRSLPELAIPSESVKLLSAGRAAFRTMEIEPEDSYVRIPVSIDDEAEDAPNDTKTGNEEEFVRISIEEDDDNESDDDEGSQLSPLEEAASIQVSMSAEEKASALKEYGNKLMVSGQFSAAEEAYSRSLHYEFSILTLNNRAQAKLSAQNFLGTIEDANGVLEVEAQNIKALYRRAKAYQELGLFAESKADLDTILRTDPANPPALKMISQVTEMLRKAEDEKRKLQADELKVQGNRAFQEGNAESALSLYTEAIQLDPDNLLIYNNRALAYLASSSYVDAISDCTRVIDGLVGKDGVDGTMLRKAYHRRAEASFRIQPRTEKTCADALRDATEAFNLQSDNPVVAELLESIRDSMKQLVSSKESPKAKAESGAKSQSSTPMKGISEKSPKTPSSATRSKIDVKVEAPTVAAKTLYEFERTWRGLAGQHALRVAYLKLFKSANFKKVFKAAISDDLLESLFEALASDDADADLAMRVLEALKQMNSFALTIRMLPESALSSLKSVFLKLSTEDVEKVSTLRSDYNM